MVLSVVPTSGADPGGTYILNHVAVVANEEERATICHIDLHSDQAYMSVSRCSLELILPLIPSVCPGK